MLWLLIACNQADEPPVSKRVEVKIASKASPVEREIELDALTAVEPLLSSLPNDKANLVKGVVNLIPGPCPSCKDVSLAQCLVEKTDCTVAKRLLSRAIKNVEKGERELIELLSLGDHWFSQSRQQQAEVSVELWVNEATPGADKVWERLQNLTGATLRLCRVSNLGGYDMGFLPLKKGHNMTEEGADAFKWEHIIDMNAVQNTCSSDLVPHIRSSPTWFVEGFRLRGHQSKQSIQRLIDHARLDREPHE